MLVTPLSITTDSKEVLPRNLLDKLVPEGIITFCTNDPLMYRLWAYLNGWSVNVMDNQSDNESI